jgi:hypothetical protein
VETPKVEKEEPLPIRDPREATVRTYRINRDPMRGEVIITSRTGRYTGGNELSDEWFNTSTENVSHKS